MGIFVAETLLNVNCYDPDLHICLMFYLSRERTNSGAIIHSAR
jgi:hypothetical protein